MTYGVHGDAIRAILSDSSATWRERFGRMVSYKLRHMGLRGFRASFYDDLDGSEPDAEKRAHDLCMMELADLDGKYKDITDGKL